MKQLQKKEGTVIIMKLVAVLEKPGEYYGEAVSRTLGRSDDVLVLGTSRVEDINGRGCELVVVSPGFARSAELCSRLHCGTLLTPDGLFYSPPGASCVVTYGMSPRSNLTLSSVGAEHCMLAVQRDITTATGNVVERQELSVLSSGDADTTLAAAGGQILLGLSAVPKTYNSHN